MFKSTHSVWVNGKTTKFETICKIWIYSHPALFQCLWIHVLCICIEVWIRERHCQVLHRFRNIWYFKSVSPYHICSILYKLIYQFCNLQKPTEEMWMLWLFRADRTLSYMNQNRKLTSQSTSRIRNSDLIMPLMRQRITLWYTGLLIFFSRIAWYFTQLMWDII